jgi:ribonuclease-3
VDEFGSLQEALGYRFKDAVLLRLALTHPSVGHEQAAHVQHNQRLEFLGDSVLELVLTQDLYHRFPRLGEGTLTKTRARLVNRRFLAQSARRLDLGRHLILSRGEAQHGGRERSSILADAFEAVVGALFLDAGFDVAREFVLRHFADELASVTVTPGEVNPKGELQERLQAESTEAPEYRVENATGPDHDRVFECAVYHRGAVLGRGHGKSKKLAETEAAIAALKRLETSAPDEEKPEA